MTKTEFQEVEKRCTTGDQSYADVSALVAEIKRLMPLADKWKAHESELKAKEDRESRERLRMWAQAVNGGS